MAIDSMESMAPSEPRHMDDRYSQAWQGIMSPSLHQPCPNGIGPVGIHTT